MYILLEWDEDGYLTCAKNKNESIRIFVNREEVEEHRSSHPAWETRIISTVAK